MRIYAIGYFEGDTYKVKRVKANTVAEAHEKANLDTPIVRIQREEYKDIGMAIEALKREDTIRKFRQVQKGARND